MLTITPLYSSAWTPTVGPNIASMARDIYGTWKPLDELIANLANALLTLPPGRRWVVIQHDDDDLFFHPADAENGHNTFWFDHGAAAVRTRMRTIFQGIKDRGATIDVYCCDSEAAGLLQYYNMPAADRVYAYAQDTRHDHVFVGGTTQTFNNTFGVPADPANMPLPEGYRMVADLGVATLLAIKYAMMEPLWETFPNAIFSLYGHTAVTEADALQVRESNGHPQYSFKGDRQPFSDPRLFLAPVFYNGAGQLLDNSSIYNNPDTFLRWGLNTILTSIRGLNVDRQQAPESLPDMSDAQVLPWLRGIYSSNVFTHDAAGQQYVDEAHRHSLVVAAFGVQWFNAGYGTSAQNAAEDAAFEPVLGDFRKRAGVKSTAREQVYRPKVVSGSLTPTAAAAAVGGTQTFDLIDYAAPGFATARKRPDGSVLHRVTFSSGVQAVYLQSVNGLPPIRVARPTTGVGTWVVEPPAKQAVIGFRHLVVPKIRFS